MIQQISFWQYQCDNCGRVARVESMAQQSVRLPVTWKSARTYCNDQDCDGHMRHYCAPCATEKGIVE
jgi:hypothetical protein